MVKSPTFGQRLRAERERLGLSQAEFAELGGVKRSSQHIYENDVRVPDLRYLERVRDAGADLEYLVLGKHELKAQRDGLTFTHQTLTRVYRLVDEFGRDADGGPLPLDERLRLFQVLCASTKDGDDRITDFESLREQLKLFTGT